MTWLSRLLDKCFRNLHTFFVGIVIFLLFVLVISVSAQYIGDSLGTKLMANKSITMYFVYDENQNNTNELKELEDIINDNYNLQQMHIKIKAIDTNNEKAIERKLALVLTKNKEYMEKLAGKSKLNVLNRNMFSKNQHFVEYSKFDEYAAVEARLNNKKYYIGYINADTNNEKNKILKTFEGLSSIVWRMTEDDPETKNWFGKDKKRWDDKIIK